MQGFDELCYHCENMIEDERRDYERKEDLKRQYMEEFDGLY